VRPVALRYFPMGPVPEEPSTTGAQGPPSVPVCETAVVAQAIQCRPLASPNDYRLCFKDRALQMSRRPFWADTAHTFHEPSDATTNRDPVGDIASSRFISLVPACASRTMVSAATAYLRRAPGHHSYGAVDGAVAGAGPVAGA
jgi:hypothetical protein